jgi:hypothetical protein
MRFASAGSYLRRWYGQGYLSIGFTCDHGTVGLGAGETITLPPPAPDWFERPFGEVDEVGEVGAAGAVGGDQFSLDLRTPAPPPVRRWLEAPAKTRGLADRGPDSYMDGGTLAQWFDIIVHRQELSPCSPCRPLSRPDPSSQQARQPRNREGETAGTGVYHRGAARSPPTRPAAAYLREHEDTRSRP